MAPTWFIVIGVILLILYILYRVLIGGPLTGLLEVLKSGQGGCGCLLKTIAGIIVGIILIWYIISELV